MDSYPVDLILATATAWMTIFLGFLPTKTIRTSFFAVEAVKAGLAWVFVAMSCPPAIMHYPLFFAILCGGSWWKFRADNALSGKMWLSIASGLGISIGIMLIIAMREQTHPQHLAQVAQAIQLASIYLGGGIVGLSYLGYILVQNASTNSGVTQSLAQRYVGVLLAMVIIRALVLGAELLEPNAQVNKALVAFTEMVNTRHLVDVHASNLVLISLTAIPMAGVVFFAFLAWRATRSNTRALASRFLMATCVIGVGSEVLIRELLP